MGRDRLFYADVCSGVLRSFLHGLASGPRGRGTSPILLLTLSIDKQRFVPAENLGWKCRCSHSSCTQNFVYVSGKDYVILLLSQEGAS